MKRDHGHPKGSKNKPKDSPISRPLLEPDDGSHSHPAKKSRTDTEHSAESEGLVASNQPCQLSSLYYYLNPILESV